MELKISSFKDSIFEIIEDFNEIETEVVDLGEGFEPNDLGNEEEQITINSQIN